MTIKHIGFGMVVAAGIGLMVWSWAAPAAALPPPPPGFVRVTKVDDGDTIEAVVDGGHERIRLIGVDTPETVHPKKPVQCFGPEASHHTKQLLSHAIVRLQPDALRPQENRDKYHRLLRFVFLPDGSNYNETLIRDGFGHEYTFNREAYQYQAEFKAAEAEAKAAGRGLWSPATCGGNTTQPAK